MRCLAALILVIASSFSHIASAQEWTKLADITKTVPVQGQQVTLVIRPELRFSEGPGHATTVTARALMRLDDLQQKVPNLLRAIAEQKSNCGTRWSFPRIDPVVVETGKLKLRGQLQLQQWVCAGPLKTFIASQTADFVLAIYPQRTDNEVALTADLEAFDPHGALGMVGAGNELRNIVDAELKRALSADSLRLKFPPDLASISPRFSAAEIRDAGSGNGELFVEAQADITPADMPKILSWIASANR